MKKFLFLFILLFIGCENTAAKNFGGTLTRTLPPGEKLVNATWKESSLWVLTRPMKAGETAETYTFVEHSDLGIFEGKVVITEVAK